MWGRIFRIWEYQVLNELSKGKKSAEELRKTLPIYGSVFDFVISELLTFGLISRTLEGNVEYFELTQLGKNVLNGYVVFPWRRIMRMY